MELFNTQITRKARLAGALLISAVALLITGSLILPGSTAAKTLAFTYNEGLEPQAQFGPAQRPALRKPKRITVRITASLPQEVEAKFKLKCTRAGKRGLSRTYSIAGQPPASRTVRLRRRFDRCRLTKAFARYTEGTPGWIAIKVFGARR